MNYDLLIPITLFICIAYSIKAVVDAYMRRRIVETHGSEALVRMLLEGDAIRRRQSALHWACVLIAVALGFGLVELSGAEDISPGVVALLLGSTGLGDLAFYLLAPRAK